MAKKLVHSSDRPAWLKARRGILTASDVAVVLGLSPFKSRLTLWLEKRGELPEEANARSTEAMELGLLLEPYIIQRLGTEIGQDVRPDGWLYVSDRLPWLGATCDGRSSNEDWPCEAKLVGGYAARSWADGVPEHYVVQVQTQMLVQERPGAYVGALVGGTRYLWDELAADRGMFERIERAGERFLESVEAGRRPRADGSDSTGQAVRAAVSLQELAGAKHLGAEFERVDRRLQQLKSLESAVRKRKKALQQEIELAMGGATLAHVPGGVTYRMVEKTVNYKAKPASTVTRTELKREVAK